MDVNKVVLPLSEKSKALPKIGRRSLTINSLMKSRVLFLLALLAGSANMSAQNLVPNGSFEEGSECPMFLDDLHFRCNDWYKSIQVPGVPMNENPSPDWYHACSENEDLTTPNFVFGYQFPSEGSGLIGAVCFDQTDENYREIFGIELLESLEIGQYYTMKFKVVAESLKPGTGVLVNNIGYKLTTYPFLLSNEMAINNTPHDSFDEVISDTLNWSLIEFTFQADSTYSFLHIGNFFDDENTFTEIVGTDFPVWAYYLFDEISLENNPLTISEHKRSEDISIYPNPAKRYINIGNRSGAYLNFEVYSSSGVLVLQEFSNSTKLNIQNLNAGLYILKVKLKNGEILFRKFSKI